MKIRQILTLSLLLILFSSSNMVFAKRNVKYPNKSCKDILKAVGDFLYLADVSWKKKDYKAASSQTQVAANYATVYATFCKDK